MKFLTKLAFTIKIAMLLQLGPCQILICKNYEIYRNLQKQSLTNPELSRKDPGT